MAKKHIRVLARRLAAEYTCAEEILKQAGLATQDTIFSPEEQKQFSAYKAEVDNNLSLLSVALSAAAQGKISSLIAKANEEYDTFHDAIEQAGAALDDPSLPADQVEPTERLISAYSPKLESSARVIGVLNYIALLASLPNRKKHQYKFVRSYSYRKIHNADPFLLLPQLISDWTDWIFSYLAESLQQFQDYVSSLLDSSISSDPANDLLE